MCGVELVPVERLKPADYNPRRADAERLALVRLSLSRLGFLLPIVATPDGEILSGHQRHAVAMSMGARQVPVMFVDIPQERRRGLNILFNRATNDIPMTADEVRLRAEIWKQKRQGDAPRLVQPPGPHGHPDVTSPICNQHPEKGCTGGKIQESPLFSPCGAWQRRRITPVRLGKLRSPENGRKVKGVAFWGDNGQEERKEFTKNRKIKLLSPVVIGKNVETVLVLSYKNDGSTFCC